MSIFVSRNEGRTFTPAPAGTFQAVCFDMWNIGWHKTEWQGKELVQPKVIIGWELSETMNTENEFNGKRFCVYKRYTLSLHDKATLRHDLESWRGIAFSEEELKKFDIEKLINVNCMLSIVHAEYNGKTYANVSSISKLMRGLMPLIPENPRGTPDWVLKLIDKSEKVTHSGVTDENQTDDAEKIPF